MDTKQRLQKAFLHIVEQMKIHQVDVPNEFLSHVLEKMDLQKAFEQIVKDMEVKNIDFPSHFVPSLCVKQMSDREGHKFYVTVHSTLALAEEAKGQDGEYDPGKYWMKVFWRAFDGREPILFDGFSLRGYGEA